MAYEDRVQVANLDFEEVKQDLIDQFKSREEFSDYEFTGSSLNLLLDILSYNTHYYSLASNFLVNESFLDTAVIRANIVSRAKGLNYKPRSASAAFTTVTVQFTKQSLTDRLAIIPAGSTFSSSGGGQTKVFNTIQDYILQFEETSPVGTTKFMDLVIYEGKFRTERFIQNGDATDFVTVEAKDPNCDDKTLTVSVNGTRYRKIEPEDNDLFNLNGESSVYFLEESRDGNVNIVFGNGIVGKALKNLDEVIISYLSTSGESGNGIRTFSAQIPGRGDATLITVKGPSSGGAPREDMESIRDNAPKWFQSQYRAVTTNDYEVMLRKKYADIQAISVWGGEDVGFPGKVFVAIKPKSADKLSASTKEILKNEIIKQSNVVTVRPEFVDPRVFRIKLDTVLIYDPSRLSVSQAVLRSKVMNLYKDLNETYIGDFLSSFRESNFSRRVKDLDNSIVSSNTRVVINAKVEAKNLYLTKYKYNFGNRLYHPEDGFLASRGGIFSSSLFKRLGQSVFSGFDEDGFGNIRLYDFINDTKVYKNRAAGRINYNTGEVEFLYEFQPVDGTFTISVIPESVDVIAQQDMILEIDTANSTIDAIDVNHTDIIRSLNLNRSF